MIKKVKSVDLITPDRKEEVSVFGSIKIHVRKARCVKCPRLSALSRWECKTLRREESREGTVGKSWHKVVPGSLEIDEIMLYAGRGEN